MAVKDACMNEHGTGLGWLAGWLARRLGQLVGRKESEKRSQTIKNRPAIHHLLRAAAPLLPVYESVKSSLGPWVQNPEQSRTRVRFVCCFHVKGCG
jgi:hypothetical protein